MKDFSQFNSRSLSDNLASYSDRIEIGWGAQKKVYRALDKSGETVALKAGKYRSPKQLERVQREVDFISANQYSQFPKHLAFSYDVGSREFLIVEEFIDGVSLSKCGLLFKNATEIATLLLECGKALQPVWDARVVHRDLKPDNIMIRKGSRNPVIIDFGIARFLDHSSLTASNDAAGPCTPVYAAREQLTNRKVAIDHRTDFFALGVIGAELLYGQHPFSPEAVENGDDILENITNGIFRLPTDSTSSHLRLRKLLAALMDSEPFRRPRSSELFLKELESIVIGQ